MFVQSIGHSLPYVYTMNSWYYTAGNHCFFCYITDDSCKKATLAADSIGLIDTNPYNLEVGSVIEYGEPAVYGVIKWIGNLPNETKIYAGLELVRHGLGFDDHHR